LFKNIAMENEAFKEELDKMELRLSDMEDKLDRLDEKLTQVVDAILGNPLTKQGGFISDIDILKVRIAELEKAQAENSTFRRQISWTVGLIVGLGIVIQFAVNIYANLKR
jgi:hypothetical protein